MIILYIVLLIIFSALLCATITPYVIQLALRTGTVDAPSERKKHKTITPRVGGVSVFFGFTSIILISIVTNYGGVFNTAKTKMLLFIILSTLVFFIGLLDDIKDLRPSKKFAMQIVVATTAYFCGFSVPTLSEYAIINYILTILWIVGITNAINLIDGLDGLASGISAIAIGVITTFAIIHSNIALTFISAILLSCLLGFLYHNFNPAKIFLGDCGSLYIGFILSLLTIELSKQSGIRFHSMLPIVLLAVPITDMIAVMVRRASAQLSKPNTSIGTIIKSMFIADMGHVHHRLIARGVSHKNAVLLLYITASIFGVVSIVIETIH